MEKGMEEEGGRGMEGGRERGMEEGRERGREREGIQMRLHNGHELSCPTHH